MILYIDYREKKLIDLIKMSHKNDKKQNYYTEMLEDNLSVGDIEITDENDKTLIIIERKTYSDLYSSIKDGRYEEQKNRLQKLKDDGVDIYYLIEKNTVKKSYMKIIEGALVSIPLKHNIKVFHSESLENTLSIINSIPKKMNQMIDNKDNNININNNMTRKSNINREHFYYTFLINLPSIGEVKAKKIMEKYENGQWVD